MDGRAELARHNAVRIVSVGERFAAQRRAKRVRLEPLGSAASRSVIYRKAIPADTCGGMLCAKITRAEMSSNCTI